MKTTNQLCSITKKFAFILGVLFICASASAQKEVFKGVWNGEKNGISVEINMDLNKQFIEDIYDMDGTFCFGRITAMQGGKQYACYSIIEADVKGNKAVLQLNTMDSPNIIITLALEDKQLIMSCTKSETDPDAGGGNYLPASMELRQQGGAKEVASTQMPEGTHTGDAVLEKEANAPIDWLNIVALFVILALTAHAFIVSRKKSAIKLYSSAFFRNSRRDRNLEEECSESDNRKASLLLDEIAEKLTAVIQEDGTETLVIETKKQHDWAVAKYNEVLALAPTDEMTVMDEVNGMAMIIQESEEREFDGSIKVTIMASIVAVLLGLMFGNILLALMFLACTALYYFSSYVPGYILFGRILSNKEALSSSLFAMIGRTIRGAQSYKITLRRKDTNEKLAEGSDNTELYTAFFTSVVVLFMIGLCISYFALWSYVKHVVLKQ